MTATARTVTSRTVSDVDTSESIVPSPPVATAASHARTVELPPRARHLWWALPLLTVVWLVSLSIVAAAFVRLELWEIAPGSAERVAPRLRFDEAASAQITRHDAEEPVLFVTALGNKLSALDAFAAGLDPDVEVQGYVERFGTSTPEEQRRFSFTAMVSAKQIAEYVALERLGYEVSLEYGELIVDRTVCLDAPSELHACSVLEPGDAVKSIDGEEIPTLSRLLEIFEQRGYAPGDVVTLTIVRHGETDEQDVRVELIESPDEPGRTIIGVWPADTRRVTLPFEVEIDTDQIGGPSAGLAFTLALVDELSAGELTGGVRVAATGTIDADGSVGAIGALRQKAVAVRHSGATVFLVPASQTEEDLAAARKAAGPRVRIEPVATLADALAILAELGGDPLPDDAIDL